MKTKIIVIVGPTASGKTSASIKLAKKVGGEIISADSRQVYKGLDIGSGKVTKKEMSGITHHLLDVMSPKKIYTVVDFVNDAKIAIEKIIEKGRVPIIVGGTGFYIDSLIYDKKFPDVGPNPKLRLKLNKKSADELFKILEKKDAERSKTVDKNNKVRLIRALEIIDALGYVPKNSNEIPEESIFRKYKTRIYGVKINEKDLYKKIEERLHERIKKGMINEVKKLHEKGVSFKRLEMLGLEYRYIGRYLQGKINKDQMINDLYREICHYAKRQMTWFKKDKNIVWKSPKVIAELKIK